MNSTKKSNDALTEALLGSTSTFDIYSDMIETNYYERILVLNDGISSDMFEEFALSILDWNREDQDIPSEKRKPIKIYINSGGGGVIFGRFFLDCITMSKTPVYTIGIAECCSVASYVLAAGKKRYCFPSTIILLHDGQSGVFSSANKAKDTMAFYDKLDELQEQFMLEHTNMDKDFLDDIKDREYYMFADEAKERGLVDFIVGKDCELEDIL